MADDEKSVHLDDKKATVTGHLQRRDEDRLADIQRRKEEKESVQAANEQLEFFTEKFDRAIKEVEEALSTLDSSGERVRLVERFDELSVSIQKLTKFVSDSTIFLPAYQVQKAQATITKLSDAIADKRDALIPKKKFAFKSKKKTSDKLKTEDVVDSNKEASSKVIKFDLTEVRFTDITGQTLTKSPDEIASSDVALARLTECTVKLLGSLSTLHMNGLRDCTVLVGPVSGSVFVDDCVGCTFVVACQQLRVHHTTDSTFYLHVTSRAIIEDSTVLSFAPYNLSYPDLDSHYLKTGLDRARNSWDDVDDFNWLASGAHSPNWAVLSEDKRTQKWDLE